jgi:hypothetical protein
MLHRRTALFVTLSMATLACGLPPARSSAAPAASSSLITSEELQSTSQSNLYDAITQARPMFFATRGPISILHEPPSMVVIENRQVQGGLEQLRSIDARHVRSVRRLSAAEVYQMTGRAVSSGGVEVVLGP